MKMSRISNINNTMPKTSFKGITEISPKAYKLAKKEIFEASGELLNLSSDINLEIIGKKGIFSKIKSLVVFVSNFGQKKGEWISLSIDPKGYIPVNKRTKIIKEFTAENIIEAAKAAKARLLKNTNEEELLSKPVMPADAVLLRKYMK